MKTSNPDQGSTDPDNLTNSPYSYVLVHNSSNADVATALSDIPGVVTFTPWTMHTLFVIAHLSAGSLGAALEKVRMEDWLLLDAGCTDKEGKLTPQQWDFLNKPQDVTPPSNCEGKPCRNCGRPAMHKIKEEAMVTQAVKAIYLCSPHFSDLMS